jgi:hypothetical protein
MFSLVLWFRSGKKSSVRKNGKLKPNSQAFDRYHQHFDDTLSSIITSEELGKAMIQVAKTGYSRPIVESHELKLMMGSDTYFD